MHQNINKRNNRAIEIKAACELPFFHCELVNFHFSFLCQDANMPGSKFLKKCCSSSKKQISTKSNIEWRAKLVDH